jgi:hypothetical protein
VKEVAMNAKRLRKLRAKIEKAGGLVHIGEDLPDHIAEAFLKEVMACPDCARAMAENERLTAKREH